MMKKGGKQLVRAAQASEERVQLVWAIDQNLVAASNSNRNSGDRNRDLIDGITLKNFNYPYFGGKFCLSISPENPLEENYGKIDDPLSFNSNPISYLLLDANISQPDREKIISECDDFWVGPELSEHAIQYAAFSLIHNIAKNVVVCANISKPGSLTTKRGYVISAGHKFDVSSFNSNVRRGLLIEEKKSLRLFRDLPFSDVWSWYSSLGGTIAGSPTNDVEIATCNFISLFDENSDLSGARDLVWSFAGLEALLAESESGIVSQLRQKLIAIFGNQVDIKDFDKQIREMYQIRSNIVHGKMRDIPTFQGHFMLKDAKNGRESQSESANFAMYILTALIQYCCQNSLSQIKFKTVVV